MGNLTKESLEKLSIHELRDVARNIGVHLPTTFKRDDLAEEILAIYSGEKQPYERKTRQGRPPKIQRGINNSSLLLPDEAMDYKKFPFKTPEFLFNANRLVYENVEFEPFVGELYNYGNYGIILAKDAKIFITIQQINEFKLQSGDEICGEYVIAMEERKVVQNVTKINGEDAKAYKPKDVQKIAPNVRLKVRNNNILIGGVNLSYGNILASEIETAFEGYSVVTLNINVKQEQSSKNIHNISFKLTDKDIFEQSLIVLHSAKRMAENANKKVILIIDSLTELIKVYNAYLTENATIFEIKSAVVKDVKEIMASTFNSNAGNFTIIDNEHKNLQPALQELLTFELNKFFDIIND